MFIVVCYLCVGVCMYVCGQGVSVCVCALMGERERDKDKSSCCSILFVYLSVDIT